MSDRDHSPQSDHDRRMRGKARELRRQNAELRLRVYQLEEVLRSIDHLAVRALPPRTNSE